MVTGKVQGVFYRASARKAAGQLGLTGWVRNLPDKSVEIMAQGTAAQLEQFTAWCKEGPPGAKVLEVHAALVKSPLPFEGFTIK